MEFKRELNRAIRSGLQGFKQFIEHKLVKNPHCLHDPFWIEGGSQIRVLNYLIQQHRDQLPLIHFIDFIFEKLPDKNIGEPLHLAFTLNKLQLVDYLLDKYAFNMNRRDEEGRLLLSLALETKNPHLLKKVLANKPSVNEITKNSKTRMFFQPLHEAIALDFAFGVRCLGRLQADLTNPFGTMKDTPLILAAKLGKIKALEALLEFPVKQLNLKAENNQLSPHKKRGDNAIESLCRILAKDPENQELIRGVAMLLCRGAEPPRSELMRGLLADKRIDLLKAIDNYLEKIPHLVEPFVRRCHQIGSALHQIIYVDHSWGNALRLLLGRPSEVALVVENWITRTQSSPGVSLKDQDKLYAEFVYRYHEVHRKQKMSNPWSPMLWMIAQGQCTWDTVKKYALSHPRSTSRIVYEEMIKNTTEPSELSSPLGLNK